VAAPIQDSGWDEGLAMIRLSATVSTYFIAICLTLISCEFIDDSPEGRAKDFLRTMIEVASDVNRNDIILPTQREEEFVSGLATRVALTYLHTRFVQGTRLNYAIETTHKEGEERRMVTIRVSHPLTSVAGSEKRQEQLAHTFTILMQRQESIGYASRITTVD
jgi:hypothetical protein